MTGHGRLSRGGRRATLRLDTREGRTLLLRRAGRRSRHRCRRPRADRRRMDAQGSATSWRPRAYATGYAVVWGGGTGRLVEELARQSRIRPDRRRGGRAEGRRTARSAASHTGIFGERVSVLPGEADTIQLPPYFASLMTAEDSARLDCMVISCTRCISRCDPTAAWPACRCRRRRGITGGHDEADDGRWLRLMSEDRDALLLSRDGALPGPANWTHEHADAANTRVSQDSLVKAPLGLLWFGGTSNEGFCRGTVTAHNRK